MTVAKHFGCFCRRYGKLLVIPQASATHFPYSSTKGRWLTTDTSHDGFTLNKKSSSSQDLIENAKKRLRSKKPTTKTTKQKV